MPIYEYRCRKCGHEFETLQRIGARPLRKCPECSGRLEKLISRTSFQLKGDGWFAEGYSKQPGGKSKDKGKTSEPAKKSEKSEKSDPAPSKSSKD